jgi:hypothetical protein
MLAVRLLPDIKSPAIQDDLNNALAVLGKFYADGLTFEDPQQVEKATVLVCTGWQRAASTSAKHMIMCQGCFRVLGLWMFDRRHELDPIKEHRPYCLWANSGWRAFVATAAASINRPT